MTRGERALALGGGLLGGLLAYTIGTPLVVGAGRALERRQRAKTRASIKASQDRYLTALSDSLERDGAPEWAALARAARTDG